MSGIFKLILCTPHYISIFKLMLCTPHYVSIFKLMLLLHIMSVYLNSCFVLHIMSVYFNLCYVLHIMSGIFKLMHCTLHYVQVHSDKNLTFFIVLIMSSTFQHEDKISFDILLLCLYIFII